MNTLPEFRKNSIPYILLQAGTKSAVYEQLYSSQPKVSYFEVFRLKIQKGGERWGKVYEDQMRIPGNEDFGKWAWVFRDIEKALAKFRQLENEPVKKSA